MRGGVCAGGDARAAYLHAKAARRAGTSKGWRVTVNMLFMVMTLDVSKLSGWLKAAAELNMPLMIPTPDVSKLSG